MALGPATSAPEVLICSDQGEVVGIDASPNMIRRAKMKADRADLNTRFVGGYAQELPFPDVTVDFVPSALRRGILARLHPAAAV